MGTQKKTDVTGDMLLRMLGGSPEGDKDRNDFGFDGFFKRLKKELAEKHGIDEDCIILYRKGFSSDDKSIEEQVHYVNQKFFNGDDDGLLSDILLVKIRGGEGKTTLTQRFDVRAAYDIYKAKGFEKAIEAIAENLIDISEQKEAIDRISARTSAEYDGISKQLIIRPLNFGMHRSELSDRVYRRVGDVALVLYQLLADGDELITSKILKKELEKWGMSDRKNQVLDEAMENTARLFPACVFDNRTKKEADFMAGDFTKNDIVFRGMGPLRAVMLTTFKTTNGAAALFYPGVIEKMMTIMGGPFGAVFMNTSDVMIFDRNDRNMRLCAQTAGEDGLFGEILSDKCYLCSEKGVSVL